jgi:predicted ATPase
MPNVFNAGNLIKQLIWTRVITPTEARRITYEETVRFEQIHERTYRELGFEIISIGPASVSDRVREKASRQKGSILPIVNRSAGDVATA